ncbi:tetratricopeptide repeat protein [Actinoplanes sp. KI2]|uniref:AfsR/SARP family transcriptional regulator n=1 Tax=Actinoplanes sp. KI2 TaxID=2983315 RepID=UPI0021D57333|nr:BTAD domain-containing putative transcriptional regulator [Actinoplanes sp. KI2]MCU7723928.1 tetratricopeptide repeat protein [Actinoplanes sp. KI2]
MPDGQERGVEFRVLGPVEVIVDGRPADLGPAKRRLVLALLLLESGRRVPVDRIVELTWEQPPPSAKRVVFAHIARLRKALAGARPYGVELASGPAGYELRVDPEQVDAARFRRLLAAGRAADDPASRVRLLRDAQALWRGPVLAGLGAGPGALRLVQGLDELRLTSIEERIDDDLAAGRHAEAAAELAELLARQPSRERMAGQLMLALYRSGRTAEALEVYRRTRVHLADELGLDPGPELDARHEAILRRDPALSLAPPAPVRSAPPPPTSGNLPRDIAGFTGRDDHLARLSTWLPQGSVAPVVTLSGLGGAGKTALAVHWAHRVADRFPGGRFYLDLGEYGPEDDTRALPILLRALGLAPGQIPQQPGEAAAVYRSLLAGRRILVILDNARTAAQVRPVLPAAPGCMALVLGRRRLDGLIALDQAHHLPVGDLTQAEATAMLAAFVGAERLAAEPEQARLITELCGRLPLALGIVGAQLSGHPRLALRTYLTRLTGGDLLSTLAIDDDDRAAVRAAFAGSYRELSAELRTTLRRVSLHYGRTVTAHSAAVLADCDTGSAAEWLAQLSRCSLIDQVTDERYRLHDLLRLFARERAGSEGDDQDAAVRRLTDWYLHGVDAATRRLYPQLLRLPLPDAGIAASPRRSLVFDSDTQARDWLEGELDNIVAVIDRVADSDRPEPAWLLADALRGWLQAGRYVGELLVVARAGNRAATRAPARTRAAMRLGLANAMRYQGDTLATIRHFRDGLALCRAADWPDGEAAANGTLGNLSLEMGDLDKAAEYYERSLELFVRTGHRGGQATSLGNLGAIYRLTGRLTQAADAHAQALALHRATGSMGGAALALANLGVVQTEQGRLDDAENHLVEALGMFRRTGDRSGEAGTLEALAAVEREAGRYHAALRHARCAVDLARQVSFRRTEADALNVLGSIQHAMGDQCAAMDSHRAALALAREPAVHHGDAETTALMGIAVVFGATGERDRAAGYLREAVDLAGRQHNRLLQDRAEKIATGLRTG